MDGTAVPVALRERLGPDATSSLLDLFDVARREWSDNVIDVCAARFEQRLLEETSKLRLEIAQGDAALRQQITELGASLRGEMTGLAGSLRGDMMGLGGSLRQDMSDLRFEIVKWCFLFWIGQVVAVTGLFALMLRIVRP